MAGFIGRYLHSIDSKKRLSFPSKLRKLVPKRKGWHKFITTKGLDGCLYVFPHVEWTEIERRLRERPRFDKTTRNFIREIMSNAAPTDLDAQGRIPIPQYLLEMVGIKSEVLIIGAMDRLELWDPETYRIHRQQSGQTFEDAAEELLI
ncbi:MAG: division/cell wall cluster transcriptional repressor MraZ [Candidatus Eisenbacteria sp.]|nr:division/cell wall cluster transcriptional repressor MraZ [Candidatus Eisenbacteria bacterium]